MEQLTLMKDFDRSQRKEESLVEHVLDSIKNLKFLRTRLSFSDLSGQDKTDALEYADQALYWLAYLAFTTSRYSGKHRYKSLEDFKAMTTNKGAVSISETPSKEAILNHYRTEHDNLAALFRHNTRFFAQSQSTIYKIMRNMELLYPIVSK